MIGPTIIGSIRRFYRIVALTTGLALFAGLVWILVSPSEYAGTASIVLTPPPASLTVGLNTSHIPNATFQGQQVAIIQSSEVAAGAATILNSKFPDSHVTASQVQSGTTVKLPTPGAAGSNGAATKVTVTLPSNTLAPAGANAVIASYLQVSHADIRQQARSSINAIDSEIAKTTSAIQAIPAPTSSKTTPTTSPSPSSTSHTGTTVVHAPRTTTTRPARTTTTRAPRTTTTTTRPPRTTTSKPTTTSSSSTSTSASARLAPNVGQLTSFTPSPAGHVVLTADAASTTTTSPVPGGNTGAGTTATTTTTSSSSSSSGGSSDDSSNANNAQQRAALQSTLSNLNKDKAQVSVNEQIDLAFTPTIFPATAPGVPANGNYLRTLLISLAIGFLVGAIIAFVLASTRRRFEKATDPQLVYRVPLITTVPAFAVPVWTRVALPILTAPTDEAAEAYRTLATVLRARRNESDCIIVSFSAADLGSGTTTTVANCGLALAEMGERALVIDGDPLGRGLTQALVEDAEPMDLGMPHLGLTELLEGRSLDETIVPAIGNTGLMVVPSGRNTDMAIHRWRSSIMRVALENLTERFDVILIDTPPMGTSSFSLDLAGIAEHLVMVIPHYDLVELHDGIARRLPMVAIELMGYVYNGTPASVRFVPYFPIIRGSQPAPLGPAPAPLYRAEPTTLGTAPAGTVGATGAIATATREEEMATGHVPPVENPDDTLAVPLVTPDEPRS